MRPLISSLAALFILLLAGSASAEQTGWFDNGLFHFPVSHDIFVSINEVESPEGTVEVIQVRPSDPDDGEVEGDAFLAISIFREALSGEGEQDALALASVLQGARGALERFADVSAERGRMTIGESNLNTSALRVEHREASALIQATAMMIDDVAVVFYLHTPEGQDHGDRLLAVLENFEEGEAPELVDRDDDGSILPRGLRIERE